jgi:hypothetical protein
VATLETWIGICSTKFEKRGLCSNYFENLPLLQAQQQPEEAAEGGTRGRTTHFNKNVENMPINVFKEATNPGLEQFRI